MMPHKLRYFLITCMIISLGLLSRKVSWVPLWTGDLLWAVMIVFIFRFFAGKISLKSLLLVSWAFCWLIEVSQLYQAEWINALRATRPGSLILGRGFLWSDLIAYGLGVLLATAMEKLLRERENASSDSTGKD